jgi:hypothetical protein
MLATRGWALVILARGWALVVLATRVWALVVLGTRLKVLVEDWPVANPLLRYDNLLSLVRIKAIRVDKRY